MYFILEWPTGWHQKLTTSPHLKSNKIPIAREEDLTQPGPESRFCIKEKAKSGRAVTVSLSKLWMAAVANVLGLQRQSSSAQLSLRSSSASSQLAALPSVTGETHAENRVIPHQTESVLRLHHWLLSQRYVMLGQSGDFKVQILCAQTCLCTHHFTHTPLCGPDKFLALNMRFIQQAFSYMLKAVCLMFATLQPPFCSLFCTAGCSAAQSDCSLVLVSSNKGQHHAASRSIMQPCRWEQTSVGTARSKGLLLEGTNLPRAYPPLHHNTSCVFSRKKKKKN